MQLAPHHVLAARLDKAVKGLSPGDLLAGRQEKRPASISYWSPPACNGSCSQHWFQGARVSMAARHDHVGFEQAGDLRLRLAGDTSKAVAVAVLTHLQNDVKRGLPQVSANVIFEAAH
jgi:hypothetical protein